MGNDLRSGVMLGAGEPVGRTTGPLDLVLDDAPLECVTSNAEQLRGFHDATATFECAFAKHSFGVFEVQVFEQDGHVP